MSGEVGSHPIRGEIQQALLSCVYGNKDNLQDLTQKRMYHQIVSFRSNLNPIADENAVDMPPATMNSSPHHWFHFHSYTQTHGAIARTYSLDMTTILLFFCFEIPVSSIVKQKTSP